MGFPVNERANEGLAYVGFVIAPTLTTAQLTAAIDISKVRKVYAICQAATLGTSATVTFKAQGATTSGGSYTDIAGSSATLVKATDDNKSLILDINAEAINALGLGYGFIKFSVSADVSSSVVVTAIGTCGREEPISGLVNLSSVKTTTVI